MAQHLADESLKAQESQSKVSQLMAQLELSNQKISRLSLEQSAQSSSLELRLKGQIAELEAQLEAKSRENLTLREKTDQMESRLQESAQSFSATKIDLDRVRLRSRDQETKIEQL